MENINFNFDKFVDDLERKETHVREEKKAYQESVKSWEPRRLLDRLYREKANNRIYIKK